VDGLNQFLILGAIIFTIGLVGALTKRNVVTVLMSIELMLNAVVLTVLAFNHFLAPWDMTGHVFALFIITVAAAEVGLGLALVITLYRNRQTVDVTTVNAMKG
jgi:NAD(P)H-quinone oxidoreductase subunit 4L